MQRTYSKQFILVGVSHCPFRFHVFLGNSVPCVNHVGGNLEEGERQTVQEEEQGRDTGGDGYLQAPLLHHQIALSLHLLLPVAHS